MITPGISDGELKGVQKPAQYLGGELNSITKDENTVDLHFCLAFPDTYEVGMSHLGMQILYQILNNDPKTWAERAYCPLPDMEKLLREKHQPLWALESKRALKDFDVVGFSLQYELCATGILNMLDLGGIPLLAKDRGEKIPLVIGGGPVAYHPEPFSDFFDLFLVGDGEEMVLKFVSKLRQARSLKLSRIETLKLLSEIQGVYVPCLFESEYRDQHFIGFKPLLPGYESIRRQVLPTLENVPFPTKPVVPNVTAVHDRLSVEVMRGCVRGCRFCQAGYLYRPQRERKPEELLKIVDESLKNTGYEEVSLLSLSTADYCSVLPLISSLKEKHCGDDNVVISFPSTRVDALKPELLQQVQSIRRAGITMAPEAGTQRLRDVINKGVSDQEILETCRNVFGLGWDHVKLYFMIGLPTETTEDHRGIVEIARKVKEIAGPKHQVTVSVSTLVPKPHTPFQWARQISDAETQQIQQYLLRELKRVRVNFRYHRSFSTFLEGVFARGDRKLSQVILKAYTLGCRLDGWVEELDRKRWLEAFDACGIDPNPYLLERSVSDPLPWDIISCDIPKRYFVKEWERALKFRETPDCLTESCSSCGACDYNSYRNVLFDRKRTQTRLNIINPVWEQTLNNESVSAEPSDRTDSITNHSYVDQRPDFGSGSIDYVEVSDPVDFPFKSPEKPVRIHENSPTKLEIDHTNPLGRPDRTIVQRLRLRYQKSGSMKFTGHLELSSAFFRAARRSGIPLAFSRGFNPRPKLSFGPPLQVGIESDSEYVDFFLLAELDPGNFTTTLNSTLPPGLKVIEATSVPLKAPSLQESITLQRFEAALLNDSSWDVNYIINWEQRVVERSKSGSIKKINLKDTITAVNAEDSVIQFGIIVHPTNGAIKPSEVIQSLSGVNSGSWEIKKIGVEFGRASL